MEKIERQKQAMLKALTESLGNVTAASKAVGIERKLHEEWMASDEWYRDQVSEIAATEKDFAKAMLHKAAQAGDLKAIQMLMATDEKPAAQVQQHETPTPAPRIPRPATEDPEQVKKLMIAALASNSCMGIVQAAIGMLADPEQRPDDVDLWEVSRATHEKWLESDPAYAETVAFLERVGIKAQKEGHWMAGLSLMSDDAAIWKAMLAAFEKLDKPTDPAKTSSPFEGKSTEELQALLEARKIKAV